MGSVLITGIAGMVGSHLADFLLENTDWKIYGFCRWNDNLENIEHLSDRINKKDRIELKSYAFNTLFKFFYH
jgi:GDPmannose 4,6-dehydratase